eukprot:5373442-Alexandrium_andersonii.AAC.1
MTFIREPRPRTWTGARPAQLRLALRHVCFALPQLVRKMHMWTGHTFRSLSGQSHSWKAWCSEAIASANVRFAAFHNLT